MPLKYHFQMYSFFSLSERKTYLRSKNVDQQMKKDCHQSNVWYTDQNQQTLNETTRMDVCYESLSLHYNIRQTVSIYPYLKKQYLHIGHL
jgi:hypothetical protein